MKTDIEIARSIALEPIEKIAAKVAIPTDHLEHYGKYLAKVDLSELQAWQAHPRHRHHRYEGWYRKDDGLYRPRSRYEPPRS